MDIRKITYEDTQTLAQFEKEIAIISFGDEAITDLDMHKKKIDKAIRVKSEGMFVITIEDEIYGWLWMDIKSNFLTNDKYVNFRSFYITKEGQKTDCAIKLMDHGMNFCKHKNVSAIVGKVHVKNVAMRMLYKRFNFEATHLTMEYNFKDDTKC
jgi:L-amino acid N-acyltransferase YncA